MFKRLCMAYFSATGTTKKSVREISKTIANDLHISEISELDFTPLENRSDVPTYNEDDIVVIGLPTFVGRVPGLVLDYLNSIKSNGSVGVCVMMYGNRAYEGALVELETIMTNQGMKVVGAGAFVGEHSYSNVLAKGRPDEKDLNLMQEFAHKICKKIQNGDFSLPDLSSNSKTLPQKNNAMKMIKPKTDMSKCTDCKICAKICPAGVINSDDVSKVEGECIKCCACIKNCPEGAKYFDDEVFLNKKTELETLYKRRAEGEYFL